MTCHRLCQWRVYARPGRFFSGFAGPRGRAALGYTPAALAPEILIVGDRSQRGSLIPRVQDLGYTVTPVRERELGGRVASAPAATAVLICLGETDAATLVEAARSGLLAEARFRFEYTRSDGSKWALTLADLLGRADALEAAYNPNDCPELRWGAKPGSDEARTCGRKAPAEQQAKMQRYRSWFAERKRPARGT